METKKFIETVDTYFVKNDPNINTLQKAYVVAELMGVVVKNTASQQEVERNMDSLSSDDNIKHYVDAAKVHYETVLTTTRRSEQRKSFLSEMGKSILANFLYSLIVAVIIWMGRDALGNYLHSIMK